MTSSQQNDDFVRKMLASIDTGVAHNTSVVSSAFAHALSAVKHNIDAEKTPISTLMILMVNTVSNSMHGNEEWPHPSVWEKVLSRAGLMPKFLEEALTAEQPCCPAVHETEEYRQFLAIRTYLKSQCYLD